MDFSPRASTRLFWQLQIGSWLLAVPLFAVLVFTMFNQPAAAIGIAVLRQAIGFGLTLVLWRIYRRWPAARFKLTAHLWKICLCCLAAVAADTLLTGLGQRFFSIPFLPDMLSRGAFVVRLVLYLAWSAFYLVIRQEIEAHATELRLARAEAANREAELQQLRAQVNPHFLFNALGTIIAEAETNPAAVVATTHAMADYLRYSLSHGGSHQAPLGQELAAMSSYLHVERASLGADRLAWKIEASDAARLAVVPTALVQPLIENALKYGPRTSPPPLQLRVHARVEANEMIVAVENSGAWITRAPGETARDSTGIGLANLRRRLELLCGPDARLDQTAPAGFVRLEVRLPFVPPVA